MLKKRCKWCEGYFEEYVRYHDEEWGVPVHDDRKHFEFLILEAAQAGLSWSTILKKRKGYKNAFENFDPQKVALFTEEKVLELLQNTEIIRNRLKIQSSISNAREFLNIQEKFGSFDAYFWSFVNGKTIHNQWKDHSQCPSTSSVSDTISKDLKKRGFKFVGSTVIYAHLQAAGLINDHLIDCFRYEEIKQFSNV
ncbi:MAG: DNA-3-methyladenine glycosylase I [Chitinophagaceae bacterium]|nr:DNA-3-methyladenine glycosylase I [Chitinophagaceae bacterium]